MTGHGGFVVQLVGGGAFDLTETPGETHTWRVDGGRMLIIETRAGDQIHTVSVNPAAWVAVAENQPLTPAPPAPHQNYPPNPATGDPE